jgi:hypothetical protein
MLFCTCGTVDGTAGEKGPPSEPLDEPDPLDDPDPPEEPEPLEEPVPLDDPDPLDDPELLAEPELLPEEDPEPLDEPLPSAAASLVSPIDPLPEVPEQADNAHAQPNAPVTSAQAARTERLMHRIGRAKPPHVKTAAAGETPSLPPRYPTKTGSFMRKLMIGPF